MTTGYSTTQHITIVAPTERVWAALITPEIVRQYMFGAEVVSTWQVGSPIVYRGLWEGQPFEDKGTILECVPGRRLRSTYFSAVSGLEDKPEHYNTVTYELTSDGAGRTTLSVTQDNNPSQEIADAMGGNWAATLAQIKQLLEAA